MRKERTENIVLKKSDIIRHFYLTYDRLSLTLNINEYKGSFEQLMEEISIVMFDDYYAQDDIKLTLEKIRKLRYNVIMHCSPTEDGIDYSCKVMRCEQSNLVSVVVLVSR